jgi:lipopolysaccharide transport system ATP-binding protein
METEITKQTNEVLIRCEGLSKKFCKDFKRSLWYGIKDVTSSFSKKAQHHDVLRKDEFWAVKDISFELRRGECLGLIGHNGAGKSTLLKLLNGLITPDQGQVTMKGRVGALIELGAGFNPVLTGRENIYNNGAVLGFSKEEIDSKLEAIIDFSELRDFIDMPVQNYSSGMKVRLGFAVAAQMEPDILLIDEVLAVGDMGFILKCYNKMDKLLQNTALILVSHSIPQVARMATKLIVMDKGKIMFQGGDVPKGITEYYNRYKLEIGDYHGSDKASLNDVALVKGDQRFKRGDDIIIEYGDSLTLELDITCHEEISNPHVYVAVYDKEQRNFAEVTNFSEQIQLGEVKGNFKLQMLLEPLIFSQGKYSLTIALVEKGNEGKQVLFRYQSAIYFAIHGETHGWAPIQFKPQWKLLSH